MRKTVLCMIKIFWVRPSKPPPPYEQLLPLPAPVLRCFGTSLNDPTPHHLTYFMRMWKIKIFIMYVDMKKSLRIPQMTIGWKRG